MGGWDARQTAMLRAMGLRVWSPSPRPPEDAELDVATMAAPAAAPASASIAAAAPATAPAAAPATAHPTAPAPAPAPADEAPARQVIAALPGELLRAAPAAHAGDADERAAAIAGMDWPALRESVAACRACGLCEGRRNTVFGVGHVEADWMVVGEAPGENEDRQGEPFVGQAGKLLDNMLRALGLSRAEQGLPPERQVYIANTLKCRPPRNRNPEPDEMARCEPFLQRQIALVKPKVILAMGGFAVKSLLRSGEAVGKLRGRVHDYQGVPLIVTYHPAYLLRSQPDKARAWEDLCLARETFRSRP